MEKEKEVTKEQLELFEKILKKGEEVYNLKHESARNTRMLYELEIKKNDFILSIAFEKLEERILEFLRIVDNDWIHAAGTKYYNFKDNQYESYWVYYLRNYFRSDEMKLFKSFYPTGHEQEILDYYYNYVLPNSFGQTPIDYRTGEALGKLDFIEKMCISMIDKLVGKDKYKHITFEEQRKIIKNNAEKREDPNLTLEELKEIVDLDHDLYFYKSGIYFNIEQYPEYEKAVKNSQKNISSTGRSR